MHLTVNEILGALKKVFQVRVPQNRWFLFGFPFNNMVKFGYRDRVHSKQPP